MKSLRCNLQRLSLRLLAPLFVVLVSQSAWAGDAWLRLAIPGQPLGEMGQDEKDSLSGWYALSLKEGVLIVEQAGTSVPSDVLNVSGKQADQLLAGKPLRRPGKPNGVSLKTSVGTLLLMRIEQNIEGARQLTPGQFPSSITADILREGWTAAGVVGGHKWNFSTTHKKRPDGKLLAGSLEMLAAPDFQNYANRTLLPRASGMAFTKQELLWLGDMDNDGAPDLLLKRTWVTGEIDFVLVVSSLLATAYFDPDRPATYFSSGVEPDSNTFEWHKDQPVPAPIKFSNKGSFTISEEEWLRLIPDSTTLEHKVLADRLFRVNGETIRFTLEHLPRAESETPSSTGNLIWEGSVLVKATYRGKTYVLMQTGQPDSGQFSLSVGLINDKLGVMINHQPHYNNSFTRFWIFDETEIRFRRLQIEHSQGC